MAFKENEMVLILGPERTGTTSLLVSLGGVNRGLVHHWSLHLPRLGSFLTHDGKRTSTIADIEKLYETMDIRLVIVPVRAPIDRIVSDVFHRMNQGEIPPANGEPWSEYIMAMGHHDDAFYHMCYAVEHQIGAKILGKQFEPPSTIYEGKAPVLVARLRDFDKLPGILQDTGIEVSEIRHVNAEDYRKDIKFPAIYVDRILGQLYTTTFYSEDEIEEMRQRWTE